MKRMKLWYILLFFTALLQLAILELNKNTVLGWLLEAVLIISFVLVRKQLPQQGSFLNRLFCWAGLLVGFAVILLISYPPVKSVPAIKGKTAGFTEPVHTAQGDVRGVISSDNKIEVFAGIPYAKPPVGDLRWKEPVPAESWQGVLTADHFAAMSMQTVNVPLISSLAQIIGYHDYSISLSDNYREPVSEDSLYLNIWKPAGKVSNLPVLVYVHGGSLQTGQPWYADYSGEGLARDGVVVVNFGYRLGIFGFFAHSDLAKESENGTTGNYGLLDQIMALQWVHDNIAAFGGDPDNVTLAGESAGSACVSALCTSPLASGLFSKVIGESSTVTAPSPAHSFRLLDQALDAGEKTLKRLNAASVEELRNLPADKIVSELNYHHHITIDGYVLNETPYESYRKGIHNEQAQLQGFNRYEAGPFILFSQADLKNYEEKIRRSFGDDHYRKVMEIYPAETDQQARDNWADIYTAVLFSYGHHVWQQQAIANDIPVYMYFFTKGNGRLGAWHSGEEVYFYGNIPENSKLYDSADRALSDVMRQYFRNFIYYGDPNGTGLPKWERSDRSGKLLELGSDIIMRDDPFAQLHSILDEIYKDSKSRE